MGRTRRCRRRGLGGRAGGVSNGAQIHSLALQDSGRNGFVCLEKHVLKKRIQRDPTSMYSVTACVRGRRVCTPQLQVGGLGSIRREDS